MILPNIGGTPIHQRTATRPLRQTRACHAWHMGSGKPIPLVCPRYHKKWRGPILHRRQLLDQWIDQLAQFLGIPQNEIGRIGGGRKKPTGQIDIATIQSLVRKGVVKDCVADYAHMIVDECHHLSAHSFELVARRAKARYVLGLSATVTRKDGHHPIIFMQCGPVRHRVDAKAEATARPFEHVVIVRPTGFRPLSEADVDPRIQFQSLYRELIADNDRNELIRNDVLRNMREGRSPLVLTERREHLELLAAGLESDVEHVVVLRFLVEDVGKQLDKVLDAILRVLALRGRKSRD